MTKITQTDFENLLNDIKQKKQATINKLSVAGYLKDKGYAPILEEINFFIPEKTVNMIPLKRADASLASATLVPRRTDILANLDFSGCDILKCHFDECDLSKSTWGNQCIEDCSFNNTVMDHNEMNYVHFRNCHFEKSSLNYSSHSNVAFETCRLLFCSFNQLKQCDHIDFINSDIRCVSILGGAKANNILVINEDKTPDTEIKFFTDQEIDLPPREKRKTKPTVLVCWNNIVPLMSATFTEKMLLEHQINPLRMDIMMDVKPTELDLEISKLNELTQDKMRQLKSDTAEFVISMMNEENINQHKYDEIFTNEWNKQEVSFPMLMMQIMRDTHAKNPCLFPQMDAIYHYAKTFFNQVDGIILTGGQDIDPRFYGQQQHPKTILPIYDNSPQITDPRRDVLEFMLVYLQQRAAHPKPLFGICRGSQVLAVSYGATFYQELDSPERRQYLIERIERNPIANNRALYSTSNTLANAENEDILNVVFMHHQGYSVKTAHGFAEIAAKQTSGGPKISVVSENLHQNVTAVQAHIEYYVDPAKNDKEGFSSHVSARAAKGIFGQFAMRVEAYSQRIRPSILPFSFFNVVSPIFNKAYSLEEAPLMINK